LAQAVLAHSVLYHVFEAMSVTHMPGSMACTKRTRVLVAHLTIHGAVCIAACIMLASSVPSGLFLGQSRQHMRHRRMHQKLTPPSFREPRNACRDSQEMAAVSTGLMTRIKGALLDFLGPGQFELCSTRCKRDTYAGYCAMASTPFFLYTGCHEGSLLHVVLRSKSLGLFDMLKLCTLVEEAFWEHGCDASFCFYNCRKDLCSPLNHFSMREVPEHLRRHRLTDGERARIPWGVALCHEAAGASRLGFPGSTPSGLSVTLEQLVRRVCTSFLGSNADVSARTVSSCIIQRGRERDGHFDLRFYRTVLHSDGDALLLVIANQDLLLQSIGFQMDFMLGLVYQMALTLNLHGICAFAQVGKNTLSTSTLTRARCCTGRPTSQVIETRLPRMILVANQISEGVVRSWGSGGGTVDFVYDNSCESFSLS